MAAIVPRTFGILLCCGATLLGAPAASRGGEPASPPAHAATAAAALRAANVRTGFCVHLGCGDGALTAELARNGSLLVHALATDAVNVAAARSRLCRLGLYGQVSVDRAHPAHLPYADGLANVVVVDETPRLAAAGLSLRELLRVLSPGGAAVLGAGGPAGERELKRLSAAAGIEPARVTEGGRAWAVVRKPRPQGTDDWTHRAYDAGGNCVSDDTAVGPLASLRWIAGPAWPMGTGYQVSNGGSVAAGGRTFHVTLNEASNAGRVPQRRNNTWFLTARDAHNGLLLWSRPIGRPMRRDGQEFARLLIAASRQVYAAVGGDLVGLDPATGRTVRTYRKNVAMSGKLALSDGTLVLSQPKSLCAMDAATGEPKWQHAAQPQDLLVGAGGVFYATPGHKRLIGLDLRSGRTRWQADLSDLAGRKKQVLFVAGGIVVFVWERNWQKGANGIAAFAAADGKRLWSAEYDSSRATWADTVWYVDGLVWRREAKTGMVGLAPATGKVVRRIALKGGYCGGCVRNIATRRYLISTRPPNFLAWDDGRVYPFRAGRHGCRAGVIVANGLLYSQPHGCKCVRESLRGFIAFAPASEAGDGKRPERLQSGPATASASEADPSADWPMFRHDPQRTGGTSAAVPAELKLLWEAKLDDQRTPAGPLADEWRSHPLGPDRLTAPVVAGGGVYAALRDAHRVVALDARSGAVRWAFTAGGRVDTPPTIHRGLCLFGCYDGWVYCLRARDGKLVWRFRAAPADRRIVAFGQIESSSPVIGGVLVDQGVAYFVAGRSAAADGGLHGFAVEPASGKLLWSRPLAAACSDLLVMAGGALRMAGGASAELRFDPKTGKPLRKVARAGFKWDYGGKLKGLWGGPNRVLDRTWHVLSTNDTASHWMRIKQGYGPHQGHLLVASDDPGRVWGFRFRYVHWSKVKDPNTEFVGELVGWRDAEEAWKIDLPEAFQVEALCRAGGLLFAAGPTDRFRRTPGGRLWVVSAADGKRLQEHALDAPPAADGLAATPGRLFLTTSDGRVRCYGARP